MLENVPYAHTDIDKRHGVGITGLDGGLHQSVAGLSLQGTFDLETHPLLIHSGRGAATRETPRKPGRGS